MGRGRPAAEGKLRYMPGASIRITPGRGLH